MKIFHFHLVSWPDLPESYDGPAWVWCPNALYDPKEGHRLYNEYLDLIEESEPLGFDGVCVNEHHQNATETGPRPTRRIGSCWPYERDKPRRACRGIRISTILSCVRGCIA